MTVPDEIVAQCSPKLQTIMSYRAFGGLGMVNGYTSNGKRQKLPVTELRMSRPEDFEQDVSRELHTAITTTNCTRVECLALSPLNCGATAAAASCRTRDPARRNPHHNWAAGDAF